MIFPILETKFFIPKPVHDCVFRADLIKKLDSGLVPGIPLILLSAPAGYGKSTLLSEWIESHGKEDISFSWLSLEETENDPIRFLIYVGISLKHCMPGITAWINDLFAAPTLPDPEEIITLLINQLNSLEKHLVLVLDDFHVIQQPILHSALEFFVDHLPPHIHLVLSTRSDPPLKLHRLRARGRITELRMQDLRFTFEEIKKLVNLGLPGLLNRGEILLLEEKTEGWAAGIRMALLSIPRQENPKWLLSQLSGQQRFIMDFLSEEALSHQNETIQNFLIDIAFLERFCVPLCDAVRGAEDSKMILMELEKLNCFLIPLDENRIWYRFHHLFADLLRVRLKQREKNQPGFIKSIHERAGHWFDENQYFEEAVQQYILAENFERAAEIVEERSIELFALGRLHPLLVWIRLLPDELAGQRPKLNIYQAWALAFASNIDEAEHHLYQAEVIIADMSLTEPDQIRLLAEIRAIRSLIAILSGDISAAIALTGLPEEIVPKSSQFARGVHRWAVGYGLRILGDIEGAIRCFTEALEIGYELDNLFSIVTTSVDLGEMIRQKGDLQKSEEIFRFGLERALQSSSLPGYVGRLESFLANILVEKRELDEAGALIEHAIEHNKQWENPNHTVYAWLINARYYFALQKYNHAHEVLENALYWTEKFPVVSSLKASLELMMVTLWLAMGENKKATNWLAKQNIQWINQIDRINESDELIALAVAKVMIVNEQGHAALEILERLEKAARQRNRLTALIQTLILKACAFSERTRAVSTLQEALGLGLVRGFQQVFIEQGERLLPTLENCQEIRGVSDLLAVIYQRQAETYGETLLTRRELDILSWMATGLSNTEIGYKLFISAGTVKAHSASIYRKLDVANRTEAISKAKDLRLI